MRVLPVSTAEGTRISAITFAAQAIHADSLWAGWHGYLAYAVVPGALFGLALRARTPGDGRITLLGAAWGLGCCIVTGLALVPILLGMSPLRSGALRQGWAIAVPLVIGFVGYGIVLGAAFGLIMRAVNRPGTPGSAVIRQAA